MNINKIGSKFNKARESTITPKKKALFVSDETIEFDGLLDGKDIQTDIPFE